MPSTSSDNVRLRTSTPRPIEIEEGIEVSSGFINRALGLPKLEATIDRNVEKFSASTSRFASSLSEATATVKESVGFLRSDVDTVLPVLTSLASQFTSAANSANETASNLNETFKEGISSLQTVCSRLTEPTGPVASIIRFLISTAMLMVQIFGDASTPVRIASVTAYVTNLPFVAPQTVALLHSGFNSIVDWIKPAPVEEDIEMENIQAMAGDDGTNLFRGLVGVISSILGFRADDKETIERARALNTNLGVVRSIYAVIKILLDTFKAVFAFVSEKFSDNHKNLASLYSDIEEWKEMTMLFDLDGALFKVSSDTSFASLIVSHEMHGRELETKCKLFNHEDSRHRQTLQEMKIRLDVLKPIKDAAIKALHLNQDRPEPVIIYIHGKPGIGKSSLVDSVAAYFHTLITKKKFNKATDMFKFNENDEYFSGYTNQTVCFIDDIFQMKNADTTKAIIGLIFAAKGDHQQPLQMAEIEKKGTTVFTSKIIICTANGPVPAFAYSAVTCGAALERRFDITIEMVLKPNMTLPNSDSVDPLKCLPRFAHATFSVAEVSGEVRPDCTFDDAMGIVVQRYSRLQASVGSKRTGAAQISQDIFDEMQGLGEEHVDIPDEAFRIDWPDNSLIDVIDASEPGNMYVGGQCYLYSGHKCYTIALLPSGTKFGEKAPCKLIEVSVSAVSSQPHTVRGSYDLVKPVVVGKLYSCSHIVHSHTIIPTFVGGSVNDSADIPDRTTFYLDVCSIFRAIREKICGGVEYTTDMGKSTISSLDFISQHAKAWFAINMCKWRNFSKTTWDKIKDMASKVFSHENVMVVLPVVLRMVGMVIDIAIIAIPIFIGRSIYRAINARHSPESYAAGVSGDPTSRNRVLVNPNRASFMTAGVSGDPTSRNRVMRPANRASFMSKEQRRCRQDPIVRPNGVNYVSLSATGNYTTEGQIESMGDVNATNMALSAMRNNIVAIDVAFAMDGEVKNYSMNAVGVSGRLLLTSSHLIPPGAEDVTIWLKKFGAEAMIFHHHQIYIIRGTDQSRDYMFIYLPTMTTQYPTIVKQFLTYDDHSRIDWGSQCMLVGCRLENAVVCPNFIMLQSITRCPKKVVVNDGVGKIVGGLLRAEGQLWKGSCGAAAAISQPNLVSKFVGIQAAGSQTHCYIAIVYRDDIEEALIISEQYHVKAPTGESRDCPVVNPLFIPIEADDDMQTTTMANNTDGFQICGKIDPLIVARAATKSSITESLLHGACAPTTRRARLTIRKVRMEDGSFKYEWPQDGSISKQASPPMAPSWNDSDVESIVTELINGYASKYSDHGRGYKPMFDHENINGKAGCRDFVAIVKDTSSGCPFNAVTHISGTPREPGKKSFFKGQPGQQYMAPIMEEVTSALEEVCKTHIPCVIATIVNKDERRPPHKADSPRTISTIPLDVSYLIRKYFMRFIAHVNHNHNESEIKIGINAVSDEWERLFNRMTRNSNDGANTFGFDYSAYDKQLPKQLTDAAIDVINGWYEVCFLRKTAEDFTDYFDEHEDATEDQMSEDLSAHRADLYPEFLEHQQIRRNLWCSLTECYYANGDIVYRTNFGNPSGNPLTTHMNSLVNQFLVRLAYMACVDTAKFPFQQNVELAVYGDDAILGVSESVKSNFNFFTCKTAMADAGIKITWPSKRDEDERPFSGICELNFLKRGFRMNQEYGHIVGPMDKDVIYETPLWIKDGMDPTDATVENYKTNLREAALHGKAFFDEYRATFVKYATYKGFEIPSPTYSVVIRDFFDKY